MWWATGWKRLMATSCFVAWFQKLIVHSMKIVFLSVHYIHTLVRVVCKLFAVLCFAVAGWPFVIMVMLASSYVVQHCPVLVAPSFFWASCCSVFLFSTLFNCVAMSNNALWVRSPSRRLGTSGDGGFVRMVIRLSAAWCKWSFRQTTGNGILCGKMWQCHIPVTFWFVGSNMRYIGSVP